VWATDPTGPSFNGLFAWWSLRSRIRAACFMSVSPFSSLRCGFRSKDLCSLSRAQRSLWISQQMTQMEDQMWPLASSNRTRLLSQTSLKIFLPPVPSVATKHRYLLLSQLLWSWSFLIPTESMSWTIKNQVSWSRSPHKLGKLERNLSPLWLLWHALQNCQLRKRISPALGLFSGTNTKKNAKVTKNTLAQESRC
jgi:hypothetical protein